MVLDRYRAAFAREAITNLAEADSVRIHTLDLDGTGDRLDDRLHDGRRGLYLEDSL